MRQGSLNFGAVGLGQDGIGVSVCFGFCQELSACGKYPHGLVFQRVRVAVIGIVSVQAAVQPVYAGERNFAFFFPRFVAECFVGQQPCFARRFYDKRLAGGEGGGQCLCLRVGQAGGIFFCKIGKAYFAQGFAVEKQCACTVFQCGGQFFVR